jgi:hypothetical protein
MSKTSETKNKILELLKGGNKRLIDIYPVLGLSPATVSQHLKEMKELNLIAELDNSHFKNEKYYSINQGYAENNYVTNETAKKTFPKFGLGVIGIALVLVVLALFSSYSPIFSQSKSQQATQLGSQSSTLNILLTDPPHVPMGTRMLNITYSSVQVHLANSASNNWITLNSTGTLDLLSLVNISKIIGSVQVPSNSIIDMVAFNITNAKIEIENQSYPIYITNNRVTGQVSDSSSFNGSSDLLVDFSPTVLTLYNDNSTVFGLVPSATAVMVDKYHLSQQPGGNPQQFLFDVNTSEGLKALCGGINITYSKITSSGNYTQIGIVIKDTSNKSIELEHVLIFGNESLYLNPTLINREIGNVGGAPFPQPQNGMNEGQFPYANRTGGRGGYNRTPDERRGNFSNGNFIHQMPAMPVYGVGQGGPGGMKMGINFTNAYNWTSGKINSSWTVGGMPPPVPNGQWMEVGGFFNVPRNIITNPSSSPQIEDDVDRAYSTGLAKQSLGVINFAVNRNGTLSQSNYLMPPPPKMQDYVLSPGQSVALAFNGTVGLGGNLVNANFTSGTKYRIDVIGSEGAYAESNVSVS